MFLPHLHLNCILYDIRCKTCTSALLAGNIQANPQFLHSNIMFKMTFSQKKFLNLSQRENLHHFCPLFFPLILNINWNHWNIWRSNLYNCLIVLFENHGNMHFKTKQPSITISLIPFLRLGSSITTHHKVCERKSRKNPAHQEPPSIILHETQSFDWHDPHLTRHHTIMPSCWHKIS